MVLAVSHLLSSMRARAREETELIPECLTVSASQREMLKRGICSYFLPGQEGSEQGHICALSSAPAFEKYISPEILKVCSVHHS